MLAKSKSGCTALTIAAEAGAADAVRILLEQGADLFAIDSMGATVSAAPLSNPVPAHQPFATEAVAPWPPEAQWHCGH